MTDEFKDDFLMYQKVLKKHPEIAGALKENERLKKILEESNIQKRMLVHELKNPLNGIAGFAQILRDNLYENEEDKKICFEIINKSTEIMSDLTEILYLEGLSKEAIKEKSSPLILENIAKDHATINNKLIQDEKIGLHLKYNQQPYHKPIEMYANKSIMNTIWGTLFSNSLGWAPPLSHITQVFRINKADNLEIIMENEYAEKRLRENGLGEGLGTPFVKKIVETMGGCFGIYETESQIRKDYDTDLWWGYKKGRELNEDTKIYGVKVVIPMSELTMPKEEDKTIQ